MGGEPGMVPIEVQPSAAGAGRKPTPAEKAEATISFATLAVLMVLAVFVGWALVRLARMRLLPAEPTRLAEPTSGRRSSAWREAGRRLEVPESGAGPTGGASDLGPPPTPPTEPRA
ncbi:MAG: hypothetical protein JNJ48_01280 [Phycisphaerae bacterium]|nr:hypothetical protein [Phycisphaerae bacterium]